MENTNETEKLVFKAIDLNETEKLVFKAIAEAADYWTGGDFTYFDKILIRTNNEEITLPYLKITENQLKGYVGSLIKKGYVNIFEENGQLSAGHIEGVFNTEYDNFAWIEIE